MITKKTINIPIFRVKLLIVVADTTEECLQIDSRVDTGCDSCVIDYCDGRVAIFISSKEQAVVIHECLHVKNAVWNRIGYEPCVNNDEVDAYLIAYIYKEVKKVIDKHNLVASY